MAGAGHNRSTSFVAAVAPTPGVGTVQASDACERVIGIFDATKWHRRALLSFAPTERLHAIVTDGGAPADEIDAWRTRGVEVVIAAPVLPEQTPVQPPSLRRVVPQPQGVLS